MGGVLQGSASHGTGSPGEAFRRSRLLVALLLLTLVAAACGTDQGAESSEDEGASGATSEESAATEEEAAPATDTAAGDERVLNVMMGAEPDNFNYAVNPTVFKQYVTGSVAETLVSAEPDMTQRAALATEWEMTAPDVWRFTLREGVTFQDGSDFNADDVVATVESIQDTGVNEFVWTDFAEAIDDHTVEIHTQGFRPNFLIEQLYMPIWSEETAADLDANLADGLMGTGPYMLEEWERGQFLTIVPYADYWGDPAEYDRVRYTWSAEETARVAALNAGEVHMIEPVSPDNYSQVPSLSTGTGIDTMALRLNIDRGDTPPVFADERLRHALRYAVDIEAINDELLGGIGLITRNQGGSPSFFGWNDELSGFEYDPDMAASLVEEAGAVGTEVSFVAPTGVYIKDREISEAVANMLEQVGFVVDLQLPDTDTWLQGIQFLEGQQPDILFLASGSETLSQEPHITKYISPSFVSGMNNPETDPVVVGMVEDMLASEDIEEREQIAREIMAHNNDHSIMPFFLTYPWTWATQENVTYTNNRAQYFFVRDVDVS